MTDGRSDLPHKLDADNYVDLTQSEGPPTEHGSIIVHRLDIALRLAEESAGKEWRSAFRYAVIAASIALVGLTLLAITRFYPDSSDTVMTLATALVSAATGAAVGTFARSYRGRRAEQHLSKVHAQLPLDNSTHLAPSATDRRAGKRKRRRSGGRKGGTGA